MHQRTVAPVAALVFVAGCAGTPLASPSHSIITSREPPTPSPVASPAPSAVGSVARITLYKVWDADGNAATTDDRESFAVDDFPPGEYPLEFEVDVAAAGGAEPEISTLQPQGTEQMVLEIQAEGESVTATVTEIRKDGSVLMGGHCFDAATQAIVMGITGGDAVSFEIPFGTSFGCTFINTPIPDPGASP